MYSRLMSSITNHNYVGGSKSSYTIAISPIFWDEKIISLVESKGHHVKSGGITHGGMTLLSKVIWEGYCINDFNFV